MPQCHSGAWGWFRDANIELGVLVQPPFPTTPVLALPSLLCQGTFGIGQALGTGTCIVGSTGETKAVPGAAGGPSQALSTA